MRVMRESLGSCISHLLKRNAHFILKPLVHTKNALRMSELCLICVFCGFATRFKDSFWHSLSTSFKRPQYLVKGN